MHLACATLSCDGFGDVGFRPSFEMLPRLGFRYVEFNCWHPSNLTPASIRMIKSHCADVGLVPIGVYSNGFGGTDRSEICKDIAHKIRMIEAARELGCRRIVATGARRGQAGGLDSIIKTLEVIAPVAEEYNTLVCLENHQGSNLENVDDYATILGAISSANIGVCIDTGHFISAGVDVLKLIERFKPRIYHVHLKEKKEHSVTVVYFEEENHRIIKKLQEVGYDGFLTIEIPPAVDDRAIIMQELAQARSTYQRYEKKGDAP